MNVVGACLLVFSGLLAAFLLCNAEGKKLSEAVALLSVFEHAKNSVENYSMPAGEILRNVGMEALNECGYEDQEKIPESFGELFEGCDISDKVVKEIFGEFAMDFGKSYRVEQTARCEYYIEKMKKRKEELSNELPRRKKMIFALSLSVAVGIVILAF